MRRKRWHKPDSEVRFTPVTGIAIGGLLLYRQANGDGFSTALIDTATGLPVTDKGEDIVITWGADDRSPALVEHLYRVFEKATRNVLRTKKKLALRPNDKQLLDQLAWQMNARKEAYFAFSLNKIYNQTGERVAPPLPDEATAPAAPQA